MTFLEVLKFNFWIFIHDIRWHKLNVIDKNLDYPKRMIQVTCMKCHSIRILIYEDGLENYY